jgi:hypothetical protein
MRMQSLLLGGIAALALSACSLVVDSKATQCESDDDCKALGAGFEQATCSAQRTCVVGGGQCSKNIDCKTQPAICHNRECISLTTTECRLKAETSDVSNENTVWLGLISPQTSGPHMEAASDLVRQNFRKSGMLPSGTFGGDPRPLAFISCTGDNMSMDKSFTSLDKSVQHLLKLGVPAIVGSNLSGDIITQLTKYTPKAGVLVIAPTASAGNISDIDTKGLFFRTSGSDTIAVKTLAHVLRTVVEPRLRAATPPAAPVLKETEQMKVAVMYRGDALGLSNNNFATTVVTFNGKPASNNGMNYKALNYGDPGDPSNTDPASRYRDAVAEIIAFRPHAIFVFGSTEFQEMDKELESKWPAAAPYRPYYLVVKGIANILATDIGTNMDWARRVYGAQPYVDKSTDAYRAYERAFKDTFPQYTVSAGVTATPSYFDATYVAAYAVAANGTAPLTGTNLANAIRTRLTPAPAGMPVATKIPVGLDKTFAVISALGKGERVDLVGLTGSLDFFGNGDVPQTQEVFCMKTEPGEGGSLGKVVGVKAAGMTYDADLDQVTGSISPDCPGP